VHQLLASHIKQASAASSTSFASLTCTRFCAGPSTAFHDVHQQLIPPAVPDWRSLMQLPIDMQEMAAAATLETGSYGYGSTKEAGYGTADAASGWRRMLLQQADAAFAPLLQPGSYSDNSTYSSAADSFDVLAEAAAAGSYGDAATNSDEGLGYGSMRKLLQRIDHDAGSYGDADAITTAGLYGSSRRLLLDSTVAAAGSYGDAAAAGSYRDAAAITPEGAYGGSRRLLQDSTSTAAGSYGDDAAAGSYGNGAAVTIEGAYGGVRRLLQDSTGTSGSYGDGAAAGSYGDAAAEGLYGGMRRLLQDSADAAADSDGAAALADSNSNVVLVVDVPGELHIFRLKDWAAAQNVTAAHCCNGMQ
jgi:hypothetical protein